MTDRNKQAEASGDRKEFNIAEEIANVHAAVAAALPPQENPEARLRLAKTLTAAGVDLPDGLTTDPVTDEDREAYVAKADTARDKILAERDTDDTATPADRRAASQSATRAPQDRSATAAKVKAAE